MILLAIDYGDARTGLAVCDKNEILATPAGCLQESYPPKLVKMILKKAEDVGAEGLILGLPKNMDGSLGFRAVKCEELAELLKQEGELPVYFVDERLTTVSAHRALSFNDVKAKKRKENIDALSASIILQSYLDQKKS